MTRLSIYRRSMILGSRHCKHHLLLKASVICSATTWKYCIIYTANTIINLCLLVLLSLTPMDCAQLSILTQIWIYSKTILAWGLFTIEIPTSKHITIQICLLFQTHGQAHISTISALQLFLYGCRNPCNIIGLDLLENSWALHPCLFL